MGKLDDALLDKTICTYFEGNLKMKEKIHRR